MNKHFEYKMFHKIRKIKIPFLIRFLIFLLLALISIPHILLPIYPGSFAVGLALLVIWVLFVIKPKKIPYLIKIRKWLTYAIKNISSKKILKQKTKDIKRHIKKIVSD